MATIVNTAISPLTLSADLGRQWVWNVTISSGSNIFEVDRDYALGDPAEAPNTLIRLEDGRIATDRATVLRYGSGLANSQGFFFEQNRATFDPAIDLATAQLDAPTAIVYEVDRDYTLDPRHGSILLLPDSRIRPLDPLTATLNAFDPLGSYATPADFEAAYGIEEAIALSRPNAPVAKFPDYRPISFWLAVASSECKSYLHPPLESAAEIQDFLKGKVCEITRQYLEHGHDRPISKHRDEITRRQFEAIAARQRDAADNVEAIDAEGEPTSIPFVHRAAVGSLSRQEVAKWL